MSGEEKRTKPSIASRIGAAILVTGYILAVLAVGALLRPLGRSLLIGISLLPAAACFLFGIPKVARGRPRGLLALFHLVLYPLFAAIAIGLPGAFAALQIAKFLEG